MYSRSGVPTLHILKEHGGDLKSFRNPRWASTRVKQSTSYGLHAEVSHKLHGSYHTVLHIFAEALGLLACLLCNVLAVAVQRIVQVLCICGRGGAQGGVELPQAPHPPGVAALGVDGIEDADLHARASGFNTLSTHLRRTEGTHMHHLFVPVPTNELTVQGDMQE